LRIMTVLPGALIVMAVVALDAVTVAPSTPRMVSGVVIVSGPYPPGDIATISPPDWVTVSAAAKDLQGVVATQFEAVLLSLPVSALTNERTTPASAAEISANVTAVTQNALETNVLVRMIFTVLRCWRRACRRAVFALQPRPSWATDRSDVGTAIFAMG
jgi:hypothetical protein